MPGALHTGNAPSLLQSLWGIGSLLLSIGILLLGHGMQLTLLPILAESAGWPAAANALTTSLYFAGFAAGCVLVPRWILAVGHIRVFLVLVAATTASLLTIDLLHMLPVWAVLRFVYGIGISGIYLVVESWLNAQTPSHSRGRVMSVYAIVTLLGIFTAQFVLQAATISHRELLGAAAIFLSLAAIPIGLTRREAPRVVATPSIRVDRLLNPANVPASIAGLISGSFWGLAPVFVARLGLGPDQIPAFMAATIGGGILSVYPMGRLSDRIGRTNVLSGLGIAGFLACLALLFLVSGNGWKLTVFAVVFGAAIMPLYPVSVAFANDRSGSDDFVETGSVVLMMHALGLVLGPAIAGALLGWSSPLGLVWFWLGAFATLALVCALMRHESPAEIEAAADFEFVPETVQAALEIDPRAEHAPSAPPGESPAADGG